MILKAQITGEVLADDGYGIPYASVMYKGHHVAVASDGEGRFTIPRHEGWTLTFSSVGYKTQTVKVDAKTPNVLKITLKEDATNLGEEIGRAHV